jgi:hypothetical protein
MSEDRFVGWLTVFVEPIGLSRFGKHPVGRREMFKSDWYAVPIVVAVASALAVWILILVGAL